MHRDELLALEPTLREKFMREELGKDKCKVLDKYSLYSNERLYWERIQEKYPNQEYFSHKMAVKSSTLGLVFHIYKLCFAKTKYFEQNWNKFSPCVYRMREGFVETELFDMEYIKHKNTGIVVDLRELARIHWVHEFKELCEYIEEQDKKFSKKNVNTNIL